MSLPEFSTQSYLFSTAALSASLFAQDDRYRLFARLVYPQLVKARAQLAGCYCSDNGRVAVEPVLLLGVSVLQFLDGQPDRAAAEMLRYHAGWNFALNRQLGDSLFHPTTLVNFRKRMIDHKLSALCFQAILDGLVEAGLIARQTRQRLDSTQIFGCVSDMSRLECLRETLRLALQELDAVLDQDRPGGWSVLWERYVQSKLDYRTEAGVLHQKMELAGVDAAQLLAWLKQQSDRAPAQGEQVQLLQTVWEENFQLDEAGQPDKRPSQPPGAVHNPHDPQAQWCAKGKGKNRKEHVGYKVQVAETVVVSQTQQAPENKGEPTASFLTGMVTQPATGSDEAGLRLMEQEQAAMGLEKASELYVDAAYVSAEKLAQAQSEGRHIVGPAISAPTRPGRFSVEDFQVCVEERQAVCPAGQASTQCVHWDEGGTSKAFYRFSFGPHCQECALRHQCLGKDQTHRTIAVSHHHTILQARRQEQRTEAFKSKMRRRNAIEGTHSELVRAHGLRRARYRGLEKMRLQNYLIGAACNVKRWLRRQAWNIAQASAKTTLADAPGAVNN